MGLSLNRVYGRRYGVIQCDPLVLKGLEITVRNPVILLWKLILYFRQSNDVELVCWWFVGHFWCLN